MIDSDLTWISDTKLGKSWVCYELHIRGYSLNQIADKVGVIPQSVQYMVDTYERRRDSVINDAEVLKRIQSMGDLFIKEFLPSEKSSRGLRRSEAR